MEIEFQGVKGNNIHSKTVGMGILQSDEGLSIKMDDFQGFGESYKKRETPVVTIVFDGIQYEFSVDELKQMVIKHNAELI